MIVVLVIPGLIYVLPNLFGDDPGLQIRATRGCDCDDSLYERIVTELASQQIEYKSLTKTETCFELP